METQTSNTDEAAVLEAIRNGDRQAFDSFCRLHYMPMLSYGRLFLAKEAAEDIIQDILLNLWINKKRIISEGCTTLNPYLLRSVYNRCMNSLRHEKQVSAYRDYSRHRYASAMVSFLDPDNNPTIVEIFSAELHSKFESAISSLPPKCREVFKLCYEEGLSEKEASEKLGISLRTAENHIHNALVRLREIFSQKSDSI